MVVGDSSWWETALGAGGIDAANQQANFAPDTAFYTDPRTGQTFANVAQAIESGYGPGTVATPVSNLIPVVLPDGSTFKTSFSQYWEDPAYKGAEPTLAQKYAYSDAEYARDFAGVMADLYVQSGADVSPSIEAISRDYPTLANVVSSKVIKTASGLSGLIPSGLLTLSGTMPGENVELQNANDMLRQLDDTANVIANWITQNLLYIVIGICAIIVLPGLLRSFTGSRS